MHIISGPKLATAELYPQAAKTLTAANSTWKPHSCGLSREELRKIVLDALG
jgi:hypothetical protein